MNPKPSRGDIWQVDMGIACRNATRNAYWFGIVDKINVLLCPARLRRDEGE